MNATSDEYEAFAQENDCSSGKQDYRLAIHRDATVAVTDHATQKAATCVDSRRPERLVEREGAMQTSGDALAVTQKAVGA